MRPDVQLLRATAGTRGRLRLRSRRSGLTLGLANVSCAATTGGINGGVAREDAPTGGDHEKVAQLCVRHWLLSMQQSDLLLHNPRSGIVTTAVRTGPLRHKLLLLRIAFRGNARRRLAAALGLARVR